MKTKKICDIDRTVAKNIRAVRLSRGVTVVHICKNVLGISHQQYLKYETAENRIPVSALYKLSCFYLIDISTFFEERGSEPIEVLVNKIKLVDKLSNVKDVKLLESLYKHIEVLNEQCKGGC